MAEQAAVVRKAGHVTPNGREGIWELRHGAKGAGALIQKVTFWPWSDKSVESSERCISAAADSAHVEIVEDWGR